MAMVVSKEGWPIQVHFISMPLDSKILGHLGEQCYTRSFGFLFLGEGFESCAEIPGLFQGVRFDTGMHAEFDVYSSLTLLVHGVSAGFKIVVGGLQRFMDVGLSYALPNNLIV